FTWQDKKGNQLPVCTGDFDFGCSCFDFATLRKQPTIPPSRLTATPLPFKFHTLEFQSTINPLRR
ncbi:MAG TPA: hypothetical protein VFW59_01890, partial [Gallionella sp.]|nr:hypothetical protein [Gallionella sp.]